MTIAVPGTEFGEGVTLEASDNTGDEERDRYRSAGHLTGRPEKRQHTGAHHRPDA